jgi:NAD(P) transhydrogenase subunit alpha
MRPGAAVASFLQPAQDPDLMDRLLKRSLTVFSMDLVPRITRAQKMDALSTVSTVAGYKAALVAAAALPRFFPLLMTAAGTVPPARVLVIGGGVAGLQAIATSRRLGAVVEGFDVRPKVKEEVQSLGATFLTVPAEEPIETAGGYAREVSKSFLERERDVLKEPVKQADVVIAAAMVPGKAAPVLITADMVAAMKPGSVVVDLAAEMGGNCELTRSGEEVVHHGIRIIGALNLASTMPQHASRMYSRNMGALLGHLLKDGQLNLDLEDKITAATCVAHQGKSRLEATAGPVAAVS